MAFFKRSLINSARYLSDLFGSYHFSSSRTSLSFANKISSTLLFHSEFNPPIMSMCRSSASGPSPSPLSYALVPSGGALRSNAKSSSWFIPNTCLKSARACACTIVSPDLNYFMMRLTKKSLRSLGSSLSFSLCRSRSILVLRLRVLVVVLVPTFSLFLMILWSAFIKIGSNLATASSQSSTSPSSASDCS
jgi:hypothetical protein